MAYSHPLFKRDREDLCKDIRRDLIHSSFTAPPIDQVLVEAEAAIQNEVRRITLPEAAVFSLPSHQSPTSVTAFVHHQFADVFDHPPPLDSQKEIPPIDIDDDALECASVSSSPEIDAQFD